MSGISAYEMIVFCIRCFALGILLVAVYYIIRVMLCAIDSIFHCAGAISRLARCANLKEMILCLRSEVLAHKTNFEAYNVVFVLGVALLYACNSYVFIDGAFRLLPFCILLAAMWLLNSLIFPFIESKLYALAHSVSILIIVPVACISNVLMSLCRSLTKIRIFTIKK